MEEARRDARLSGGLGYRPALDGLRGISILAVMAYHSGLISGGFLGVDAFFALSGFLITTLLLDERARTGAIALGRFYARRALRLLPALVALLVVCAPLMRAFAPPEKAEHTVSAVVVVLFYTANWALMLGQPLYVYLGLDTRADSLLVGCAVAVLMTWRPLPARGAGARAVDAVTVAAGAGLLALFLGATWPHSFLRSAASARRDGHRGPRRRPAPTRLAARTGARSPPAGRHRPHLVRPLPLALPDLLRARRPPRGRHGRQRLARRPRVARHARDRGAIVLDGRAPRAPPEGALRGVRRRDV